MKKAKEVEVIELNIDSIVPHPKNPKKHWDEGIVASIQDKGYIELIVVDEKNRLLAGEGRWRALKKLGHTTIKVIRKEGLSEKQKLEYLIASNKLTERGGWDADLLKTFDIDVLQAGGLQSFEIDKLFEKDLGEDEFDAEAEILAAGKPKAKIGDVLELGPHRLMCGDSLNPDHVSKLVGKKKIDILFMDPPYGMNLNTDWSDVRGGKYRKVEGDDHEFNPAPFLSMFGKVREQFWWGADYYLRSLPYGIGSWLVWDKRSEEGFESTGDPDKMIGSMFELCWSKNKHRREILRFRWAGSYGLWQEDTEGRIHPTQKPSGMIGKILTKYGRRNDVVLDLFLGSGSTLIAAEKTGRVCYGMEIDPRYVDVIVKRY